ncbi:MAG: acyltransferase [Caulobacteraceae bacterium]|nr:acyltransferase [Caulobacteraceae bacterium]
MKQHYLTLDALRGVAAIAVVARHLDGLAPGNPFPASYLAVDFFFGLSGFVLAHAYGRRLGEGMSFRRFALARLIRLYPLYFIAGLLAILTLGLKIVVGEAGPIDLLVRAANLVFIPLPLGEDRLHLYPLNFPAWSLGFELLVNAVFAVVIFRLTTWRLVGLLVVSAIALTVAALYFGTLDVGSHWSDILGGVARVTFSFFLGVGVYRLHRAFPVRLPGLAVIPVTLILLASFLPAVPFQGLYDVLAIVVIFPLLLFVGAAIAPPQAAQGVCTFLGVTSYAIYVIHVPMRDVVLAAMHYLPIRPSWGLAAAFILIALVASWIVDKVYDGPVRTWLSGKFLPASGRS